MGYLTTYDLTVYTPEDDGRLQEYCGDENFKSIVASILDFTPFYDCCKWYDHESDMKIISKKFPNHVFKLHGEGEESGDIWDKWFMNGKMQICIAKIIIPDFNPELLQ